MRAHGASLQPVREKPVPALAETRKATMERIIAGRFETKGSADAAAVLMAAYVDADDICIFHNNPPGQHDAADGIGGTDEGEDPGAEGAGETAAGGALAGGMTAGAIGAIGGPVVALGAAAVGAYVGSLVGAMNGKGTEGVTPTADERRPGGVMLSVRIADPANESRVIAALRAEGASDIEHAEGVWTNGDWSDFDPLAAPQRVEDPSA